MDSKTMFAVTVIGMALFFLFLQFKTVPNMIKYFKTKEGRGVLVGIVLFVGIGLLSVSVFAENKYLAYGEVFLGIDNTKNTSPMCEPSKNSDRLTSNGGFRLNLVQSEDRRFEFNTKYTHHSCAFGSDRKSYDAIGLEATYKFWSK